MMSDHVDEAKLGRLAELPILASDPKRAERTRRRCRARLMRQPRSWECLVSQVEIAPRGRGPVVVSAFCVFYVVYVSALVATALRLHGLLR
jgi:hypothetical protein